GLFCPHGDRRDRAQSCTVEYPEDIVGCNDHVVGVFVLHHDVDELPALQPHPVEHALECGQCAGPGEHRLEVFGAAVECGRDGCHGRVSFGSMMTNGAWSAVIPAPIGPGWTGLDLPATAASTSCPPTHPPASPAARTLTLEHR